MKSLKTFSSQLHQQKKSQYDDSDKENYFTQARSTTMKMSNMQDSLRLNTMLSMKASMPSNQGEELICSRIDLLLNKNNKNLQQVQHILCKSGFYQGQIGQSGLFNGFGSMFYLTGAFYYGQWADGRPNGIGVYVFETGGFVRGNFKDGFVHGCAEIIYQNYDSYQGEWHQGTPHGFGRKLQANGDVSPVWYEYGEKTNKRWSQNNEIYNKDVSFQFMRGLYFDQLIRTSLPLVYNHPDRIVYGLQCDLTGLGCIIFKNGRQDMGFFKNGTLEGRGHVVFASGDIYDGYLVEGQFQGQGQYSIYSDQSVTLGIFEKNKVVLIKDQLQNYPPPIFVSLITNTYPITLNESICFENNKIEVKPLLPVDTKIKAKNTYTKLRRINNFFACNSNILKKNTTPTNLSSKVLKSPDQNKSNKIDGIQALIGQVLMTKVENIGSQTKKVVKKCSNMSNNCPNEKSKEPQLYDFISPEKDQEKMTRQFSTISDNCLNKKSQEHQLQDFGSQKNKQENCLFTNKFQQHFPQKSSIKQLKQIQYHPLQRMRSNGSVAIRK